MKDLLSIEIRRLETELISLNAATEKPVNQPTKPVASSTPGDVRFTTEITNYGWDQSDKYVKLFVTLPDGEKVQEDQLKVNYSTQGIELLVQGLKNKDYKLVIKNLLESVVPEKAYHKIKPDMVVIYMLKEVAGKRWEFLTKTAKKVSAGSKSGALEGMDDNPNAALMNIMKQMYESGDPATKQMIEKAYTENMTKSMGM